jgi:hypothetical protein
VAHGAGPVHEQRHRRRGRQLRHRHGGGVGRQQQRRHRILLFGAQPQHRSAGGKDRHPATAGQQLLQVAGDPQHLLQVVEDEQPGAVAELLDQGLQGGVGPGQVDPHRPGDAGQDLLGPGHPNQRDEDHAGVQADA